MKKYLTITFLMLLFPYLVAAQEVPQDRLQRIQEATVRVSVRGGIGTGTIFKEDSKHYFILTNAHVVGNASTVNLEFHKSHWPSPKIKGVVVARRKVDGAAFDVAIVKVLKSKLSGIRLPVIPLSEEGPKADELLVLTCGCQGGAAPSLQQCIVNEIRDKVIRYTPTALPGRSGSMITDVNGKEIKGLVAWMTDGNRPQGLAMSSEKIYSWVDSAIRLDAIHMDETSSKNYLDEMHIDDTSLPEGYKQIPLTPFDSQIEANLLYQSRSPKSPWVIASDQDEPALPDGIESLPTLPPRQPPIIIPPTEEQDGEQEVDPFDPSIPDSEIIPEPPKNPDGSVNPWSNPPKKDGDGKIEEVNPGWSVRRLVREGFIRLFQDLRSFGAALKDMRAKVDDLNDKIVIQSDKNLEEYEARLGLRFRGLFGRMDAADAERREFRKAWTEYRKNLSSKIDNLPKPEIVDSGKISDKVTRGVLAGFLNLPLIRTIRETLSWLFKIIFWGSVILIGNWIGTQLMGPAWFGFVIKKFVNIVKSLVGGIASGVGAIFSKGPDVEKEAMASQLEELQKTIKELQDK